jgi:FKBP-type peptidyl-prolyl cis-trans isomerase SlyD
MSVVAGGKVVSVDIEVRDAQGELIQESGELLVYLHGGYGGLIEALEDALEGRAPGERVALKLEPEQAFGDYDAELLRVEERSRYGDGLQLGMEVDDDFGGEGTRRYTVTDLTEDKVVLDGNHPLAGMALCFDCRVVAVRDATAEELEAKEPKVG